MSKDSTLACFLNDVASVSSWYVIPGMTVAVHYYEANPVAIIAGGIGGIWAPVIVAITAGVLCLVGSTAFAVGINGSKPTPESIGMIQMATIGSFSITLGMLGRAGPFILAGCSFWVGYKYFA